MQTPTIPQIPQNYSETWDLIYKSRDEAKETALAALRDHLVRMQALPAHPIHKSYIDALEFAITLVRFS